MNRRWNSNSVYFLNVCQNWMTVIMGSLNLPFLYREISFTSEALTWKNSSSHLVLTLTNATFLTHGIQNQWCLWSGTTIIEVRRQMIYCKWRKRRTHLLIVPTDFCLRSLIPMCSLFLPVAYHTALWSKKTMFRMVVVCYLGTCLYSQQFLHFLRTGFLKEAHVVGAGRRKGDKPSKIHLYLIMFLTSSLCALPTCQAN